MGQSRSNPEINLPDKFIDIANAAHERYGKLWQFDECCAAMEFLENNLPNGRGQNFIEVGSADGASFACWATLFDGLKISVDMSGGCWHGNTDKREQKWKEDFTNVHSVVGDSNLIETAEQVAAILDGQTVDWLFIDANHDYEPTKRDYELYSPFVRSGGFIGFHDINHPAHREFGCGKVWRELGGEKWETSWHQLGIGILKV